MHKYSLSFLYPFKLFSNFATEPKSASSRIIKRDFLQVKKKLWKGMFWSRSFYLLTTGGSPIDVVKKYIENQGEK
ncbi:transposase [Bacillus thuringiensis]|uniref:transposase n=1 Tax=Bacillus thuringiensis TaxID=1428 RepID=UPI0022A82302|nr:transposase [Bacillus thuringiensis]